MIRGRSVGLRPVEFDDLGVIAELTNDISVRGLVVGWDWPVVSDLQKDWFANSVRNRNTIRLTVVDLETQSPIGLTGLWDLDWHNRSALTAIKLVAEKSPKGAGRDVIMLMNAFAFYDVGLHRLHSAILDFNGPSFGAYVGHCGWRIEGRELQSVFRKGAWQDLYRVAILRTEFDALAEASEYINFICPVDVAQEVLIEADWWRG